MRDNKISTPEQVTEWNEQVKAQREALSYWTLHAFKVMVDTQGIEEVIKQMDGDTFWKLYTWVIDECL